jgi:hypothetical protein
VFRVKIGRSIILESDKLTASTGSCRTSEASMASRYSRQHYAAACLRSPTEANISIYYEAFEPYRETYDALLPTFDRQTHAQAVNK